MNANFIPVLKEACMYANPSKVQETLLMKNVIYTYIFWSKGVISRHPNQYHARPPPNTFHRKLFMWRSCSENVTINTCICNVISMPQLIEIIRYECMKVATTLGGHAWMQRFTSTVAWNFNYMYYLWSSEYLLKLKQEPKFKLLQKLIHAISNLYAAIRIMDNLTPSISWFVMPNIL